MNALRIIAIGFACALLLAGAPGFAQKKQTNPQRDANIEFLGDGYIYNPLGKRDPFEPFTNRVDAQIIQSPLQRYDSKSLKVQAIMWGIPNPRAMVAAPDGKKYYLRVGDPIGIHKGKVTAIREGEVVITEEFKNVLGEVTINDVVLQLSSPLLGRTK
jgi:Tfp pilus assembly protein PilP